MTPEELKKMTYSELCDIDKELGKITRNMEIDKKTRSEANRKMRILAQEFMRRTEENEILSEIKHSFRTADGERALICTLESTLKRIRLLPMWSHSFEKMFKARIYKLAEELIEEAKKS
ncbi:MAG: hypothetical protein ABFS03_04005 [Chloroflexota bacterium]